MQQFDLFGGEIRRHRDRAGDVAAGPGEGLEQAAFHPAGVDHDDRDGGGRAAGCLGSHQCAGDDHLDPQRYELAREFREPVKPAFGETFDDLDGPALDPAALAEAVEEGVTRRSQPHGRQHAWPKRADPPRPGASLRACRCNRKGAG